jgi:citronellol/citronellal dehydrogenase
MTSESPKVAIITGASRGIGRAIALGLAEDGWRVVVAAKSIASTEKLPGSIHTVVQEIATAGGEALPIQVDVRDEAVIEKMVATTIARFGRVDLLINNAGALFWEKLIDTPGKRFDLVMAVNARAAFLCSRAVLPHMIKQNWGNIINMSPPLDLGFVPGRIAYCISKFGMTLLTHGLAAEVKPYKISVTSLWPRTIIESQASINWKMGDRRYWRKPDILVDCVKRIVKKEPPHLNGQVLIDEDFLRTEGVTDFSRYSCVSGEKPTQIIFEN